MDSNFLSLSPCTFQIFNDFAFKNIKPTQNPWKFLIKIPLFLSNAPIIIIFPSFFDHNWMLLYSLVDGTHKIHVFRYNIWTFSRPFPCVYVYFHRGSMRFCVLYDNVQRLKVKPNNVV